LFIFRKFTAEGKVPFSFSALRRRCCLIS
jgi:hypothetical protein